VATSAYISGRKTYARPQALLFADSAGTLGVDGYYYPDGTEKENFIVLSDHNRSEISISQQRIETRQRMINGTMRSYHIADKTTLSVSWNNLPSRSFNRNVLFDVNTGNPVMSRDTDYENTVDGGAGGAELLNWYEENSGPFWVYLAYDKYINFKTDGVIDDTSFEHLAIYNDIKLMYFSSFEYTISKRGGTNFDFWNVSLALEEA
jgi:hypothetical protein